MKYKDSALSAKSPPASPGLRLTQQQITSPILDKLNELAIKLLGMRLVIVYPTSDGLEQVIVGTSNYLSHFCKLIQDTKAGAEHCRMCHVVMTRSARSNSATLQRCHTGASAMVRLVAGEQDSSLAVLSSCCLADQNSAISWPMARRRAKALGIDEHALKNAHQEMIRLDPERSQMATWIIDIAGEALRLIVDRIAAEAALEKERKAHVPDKAVTLAIEQSLQHTATTLREAKSTRTKKSSRISTGASPIDIISDVVANKPYLPFTLRTVSASIQITANHFSHLFHKRHGICFSDFLTESRLNYSKGLLKDQSLNIAQVALKSGFHDAGYFTRRFKQKTGLTPREWRRKLERG